MKRWLLVLAALALIAGVAGVAAFSRASFTTTSTVNVSAGAATISDWLHLYSQGSDPQGATTYARKRTINGGTGTPMATGVDATLTVDMGGFPDKNKTYAYAQVFSLATPATFPDTAVTQITVSCTLVADATDQPLTLPGFTVFGGAGGGLSTVNLGPGQKYQFNVTVKTRKKFTLGHTYTPHVLVSATWTGVPAGYLQYDIPFSLTDVGGN